MTSLRVVINYVHSASFEAINTNENWEFKTMQALVTVLQLMLQICCSLPISLLVQVQNREYVGRQTAQ